MRSKTGTVRRRLIGAAVMLTMALGAAPGDGGNTWQPHSSGWVSGPLEHVNLIPVDGGGAVGATLRGDLLYVASWRSFTIYDVSDPELPVPLSTVPLGIHLFNEQPSTNGKIAILTQDIPRSELQIWDVSDPTAPTKITSLSTGRPDHMWTCVLDCRYAYGGRGTIVDLKDPASPEIVGDWAPIAPVMAYHAIEEVAPG